MGVHVKSRGWKKRQYQNQAWLTMRVSKHGFGCIHIARECGVSDRTVLKWMKRYDLIGKRKLRWPQRSEKRKLRLSLGKPPGPRMNEPHLWKKDPLAFDWDAWRAAGAP